MSTVIGLFSLLLFILLTVHLLSDQTQTSTDVNFESIVAALVLIAAAICFK